MYFMGGGGSSGGGTTTVTQQPPQLLPESRPGYLEAQNYYRNILQNPPVYQGPRVAPVNPLQEAYMTQAGNYFGQPQSYQLTGENQLNSTLAGDYLYDPNYGFTIRDVNPNAPKGLAATAGMGGGYDLGGVTVDSSGQTVAAPKADYKPGAGWQMPSDEYIQKWVESAQQPYLRKLQQDVLPQIQSTFGTTGAGVNNIREQYAQVGAVQDFTTQIGKEILAPIFNQMQTLDEHFKNAERDRVAAIASGDANRITQASAATASLANQRAIAQAQILASLKEHGASLTSNERIAAAQLATTGNIEAAKMALQGQMSNQASDLTRAGQRADVWNAERNRMVGAIKDVPTLLQSEAVRQMMLRSAGDYERAFQQENVNAQREQWQEPLQEQASAANALFGASVGGPSGGTSTSSPSSNVTGQVMSGITTAAQIAALVAKMAA